MLTRVKRWSAVETGGAAASHPRRSHVRFPAVYRRHCRCAR